MGSQEENTEEPKLTYERVLNDLSTIIQTDSITSACLHSKLVLIGTKSGRIHVFDHQGNKVKDKEIRTHLEPVNNISIDSKGEHFVSCSNDRLVVYGLCDSEHNFAGIPDKPIDVVAIDPIFHKPGRGRKFVIGNNQVVLYERGSLFKTYKQTVLQSKEQRVRNISWHGQFIAWATDFAVQIYDTEELNIITRIKKDSDLESQDACQFCWKDNRTLLIGWSKAIKFCLIKERSREVMNNTQLKGVPRKYVEIVSMFETDFTTLGLAPFNDELLTLSVQSSGKPEIRVLKTFSNYCDEQSKDVLTQRIAGQQHHHRNLSSACKLLSLHEEGIYFIVCPEDVILAKPRDSDDHFEWLIEHSKLEECYNFAKENSASLIRHSIREVGELYMQELFDLGTPESFSGAAKLCASICDSNQEQWDDAIKRFCDSNQLKQLLPHLPQGLKKETYDYVLEEFLKNDSVSFFKAIKELPSSCYSLKEITNNVIKYLANDPKNLVLNEALAELYTRGGKFEDAVNIYLDYNDKNKIFSLIRSNNLVTILENRVDRLMQLDANEASQLLVENIEFIPMERVVSRLEKYKSQRYLVSYLHRLILKDPDSCIEYHDLMLKLYAQHQRESLLSFLKLSTNYSLEEALRICKEFNLIKEVVFLLCRMGDLRVALRYIIEDQADINEAIEFCKEHQDSELWQDLIKYSTDNPKFVAIVLKSVGTHIVDPIELIDRIPIGCDIEGLMPALVKFLRDYQMQITLETERREQMSKNCFNLLEKQIKCQTQGIAIKEDQLCNHCHQPLIADYSIHGVHPSQVHSRLAVAVTAKSGSAETAGAVSNGTKLSDSSEPVTNSNDIVVFGCHHVFHEECCGYLPSSAQQIPSDAADASTKSCRVCMLESDPETQSASAAATAN